MVTEGLFEQMGERSVRAGVDLGRNSGRIAREPGAVNGLSQVFLCVLGELSMLAGHKQRAYGSCPNAASTESLSILVENSA